MGFIIQEYLKKINSRLTYIDILSLFVTFVTISSLVFYLYHQKQALQKEVLYQEAPGDLYAIVDTDVQRTASDPRPFGSVKGKTYTFSWCQGASRISANNKIYFGSEGEAERTGRTLSKLCKK